jgi:hypothetical protein
MQPITRYSQTVYCNQDASLGDKRFLQAGINDEPKSNSGRRLISDVGQCRERKQAAH